MMFYAVNLPVFLRRLVVGWESRLADAEETFPPLAVKLPALNDQQSQCCGTTLMAPCKSSLRMPVQLISV